MNAGISKGLLAAAAVTGVLFAASPAAAITWTCKAAPLTGGASYTASASGVANGTVINRARSNAIQACQNATGKACGYVTGSCFHN